MDTKLPIVDFGKASTTEDLPAGLDDVENHVDDDEELEKTPDDVVELLGFDPKDD